MVDLQLVLEILTDTGESKIICVRVSAKSRFAFHFGIPLIRVDHKGKETKESDLLHNFVLTDD